MNQKQRTSSSFGRISEQVIEQSELDQQLRVAGDAIASIVEVYAIRANAILSSLSVQDTKTEPILAEDFQQ